MAAPKVALRIEVAPEIAESVNKARGLLSMSAWLRQAIIEKLTRDGEPRGTEDAKPS